MNGPKRIACLSTETVEVLYLLGEEDRIAGISGFTVRPARARKEKPKISGFSTAKIERILAVQPDLVLAYSNLQADMVRDLVKEGLPAHVFNQRSVADILDMVRTLGALVDAREKAEALIRQMEACIEQVRAEAASLPRRPLVYFEEWNEPLISGIQWVGELVEIAGGRDAFPELSPLPQAGKRIIGDPMEVVRRQPDLIIGSWCGRKFAPESVRARPGWDAIPAIRDGELHELKSAVILTPGPCAILEGLPALAKLILQWAERPQTAAVLNSSR